MKNSKILNQQKTNSKERKKMKNLNLKELEKVNGSFYLPWWFGYSEAAMEATGRLKVQKHFFAPNSIYDKSSKDFIGWWVAQAITFAERRHPTVRK